MKKLIFSLFFLIYSFVFFAQIPAGPGGPGGQNQNRGRVFGKVVDELGKPVEFATVVVFKKVIDPQTKQSKDVSVKAQQSQLNGDFNFTDLPIMTDLKLKISSIGYQNVEANVRFNLPKMDGGAPKPGQAPDPEMMAKMMSAFEKDLGNLKMAVDNKILADVVVTGTKPLLEMDIDKKSFNVEKNIVTAGGTAVDIMRNIPSIQVDIDGNVKLRNAAPILYIDGRPTTLSLDQIPADAIEKVEVITNPSAKYDASGSMAGILNIVLKKNKKSGYNGMVNVGGDRFEGSNLMGSFNIRQNKINLSLTGMNNRMRNNMEGTSERTSTIENSTSTVSQDIHNKNYGSMTFTRFSLDYFVTNRTTLSVGGVLGGGNFKPTEEVSIKNVTNNYTSFSNRISASTRSFTPTGLQLGFKHNFPTAGEELSADLNYFGGTSKSGGEFTTSYLGNANQVTGTQIQRNIGNGNNTFATVQIDYVKPLKNEMKIETGLRSQSNTLENVNDNSLKRVGSDVFQTITSASTNYTSKNSVYAAYFSISGKSKKFANYKIGLRAESSAYEGELLNTAQKFSNSYPISLFPSIFLSKELSKTDQIQLSITRRVNRPNFFQIIPFVDYSDSLNITRGYAGLVPEFTSSGELSYSKSKGSATFLMSGYYKYTTNLITRYLNKEINPISGKTDLINSYINANSSTNFGMEFTYSNKVLPWWDLTASLNTYNSKINTSNVSSAVTDPIWTVFGKLSNNMTLPKKWVIQLTTDYQGKTNMPVSQNQGMGGGPPMNQAQSSSQGYIKPFYGVDIAFKKSFLKNDMASLTLSFNDLFRTRGNTQVVFGDGFSQTYYRLNNAQNIRLNLSFRFGQMTNMFKKNDNSSENMQM